MLRKIHDPERGASLIEYAAVIVLAAAILAGIINSGITASITGGVTGAMEKLTVPDQGESADQQPGGNNEAGPAGPQTPSGKGGPTSPRAPEGKNTAKKKSEKDKKEGGGGGGGGGMFSGLNMTGVGVGGPFNPGVKALEKFGGDDWFDDLSNHDVWLDPEKHLPDMYGTDLFPPSIPLRLGLQQAGLSGDDFGWFGEQYADSQKVIGDLGKEMLSGGVNTALHPQQMVEAGWESAKKSAGDHVDGMSEIAVKNLKESNGDIFDATLGITKDSFLYHSWQGPLSPSRIIVNEAARNDCTKGDYGKCVSRVGMSMVELLPIAKGPSIAGKLSKGLTNPGAAKPKGGTSKRLPGNLDADGNRNSPESQDRGKESESPKGGKSESPSCTRPNSFIPGTPVLLADGSTIPIEDVEVGDEVHAFDPRTGEKGSRPVTDLIRGQGKKTLVTVTAIDQDGDTGSITATDEHPFWAPKRAQWVDAIDLTSGTWLRTSAGTWAQVTAVKVHESANQKVRNLTVSDLHTYYIRVGTFFVLVHNTLPCGEDARSEYNLDYIPTNPNQLHLGAEHTGYIRKAEQEGGVHLSNTGGVEFEDKFKKIVNDSDSKIKFDVSSIPGGTLEEKIDNAVSTYELMGQYGVVETGADGLFRPSGNGGITKWELYYLTKSNLLDKVEFSGT